MSADTTTEAGAPAPLPDASWELALDVVEVPEDAFLVDVDGFEGPLDLLLALARTQKVDLSRISILALVDQYLAFISSAATLRLELAADYLVMAAWLAFLKSKLLLPKEEKKGEEPTGEELAARLSFRLMRLEAMRDASAKLMTRKRLGRDVFARGEPEGARTIRETRHTAAVYDLLKAYADRRQQLVVKRVHVVRKRTVWSVKEARMRLEKLVGGIGDWTQLELFLEQYLAAPELGKTVLASSFGATLEMAREGLVELYQSEPFAPIYMRRREGSVSQGEWERIG
ncbi:MAG: segregation/condensation protein A [Hyphomicrobiaceae bacterium]|nr:MAG: segregation/condensation protein A [Hyphomicrobiaceae bacterium]